MTRTPLCRSCLAPIVWIGTRTGKNMPVDATPAVATLIASDPQSTFEDLRAELGDRIVSHFATCPNAAQHRRDR